MLAFTKIRESHFFTAFDNGYDAAGNLTNNGAATYNVANQLTSGGAVHDATGNQTTIPDSPTNSTAAYDVSNHMTSLNGATLQAGYYADGQRMWKQPNGGSRTYFLSDGGSIPIGVNLRPIMYQAISPRAYQTFSPRVYQLQR